MARCLLRCRLVLAVEIEERFFFFLFWRRARRERDISGFFLIEGVRICAVGVNFVGNCKGSDWGGEGGEVEVDETWDWG